jgi:amino acid transporter
MVHASSAVAETGADERQLASLGYRQQLSRSIGLLSNFAVGFTYLSPVVGVYSLFAFGLATGGPAFIWSVPVVVFGQFMVVFTFSEIVSQFPLAGGIYQWSKRLVGPRYAFMSGWMYTVALLITVAAVAYAANLFAAPLFGWENTPTSTVLMAVAVIVLGGILNMLGIRRLALLARAGLIVEIAGTLVLGAYLLLFDRNQDFGVIFDTMGAGGGAGYLGAFLAAALFSVWIFYGFEACGDIAEEVHDPSRQVPRAMQLTLAVGGATSFFLAIALILAVPDIGAVMSGADASPIDSILLANFGDTGSTIALALILFAFVSCTIAIQGAAIRLVYSFARDGMVVGSRALSSVHPRFHMPPGAVIVAVVIPALITLLPSATVTVIITFAVVGIYIGFQSVVLAAIIARARGWRPSGSFKLGSWGWPVNLVALLYGVSAIIILSFKTGEGLESFVDRWLVPLSAGVVFLVGLAYLLIVRPAENIREDARADTSEMG